MFETEDTKKSKNHLQIPDTSWTLLQSSSCFSTCTCMSTLQKLFIVIYTVHHTPLLIQKTSTVKLHGFESAEIVFESNQSGNSVSNADRMCKKKLAAQLSTPLSGRASPDPSGERRKMLRCSVTEVGSCKQSSCSLRY